MKVKNPYAKKEKVEFNITTHITQNIRFKLLSDLLKDGLPEDLPKLAAITSLLKDCDSTALATKRVEGEATLTDVQAKTFQMVNVVLNNIKDNPFINDNINSKKIEKCTVPDYEIVEGEDIIGIEDTSIFLSNLGNGKEL